ncbi:hypothetical protein FACS1894111_09030 [Clostridia bacterium]|nr:hypothetical protein FACS1894111_09030 [Clostridia bacterium]
MKNNRVKEQKQNKGNSVAKRLGVSLVVVALAVSTCLPVFASSFTDRTIYGSKWTAITAGTLGSGAKIYGTITKIYNSDNVDKGYSQILVAPFSGSTQLLGEQTVTKNKAYSIALPASYAGKSVTFSAKGHNSSLNAIISGDVTFN